MITVNQEWWKEHFTLEYYKTYSDFTSKQKTSDEVSFLKKVLSLKRQKLSILDLGCGIGRHSIELASLRHSVTGIDYSNEYILRAKDAAKERGVQVTFLNADMRNFSSSKKFDAAISMFSSFGYFPDFENEKVIENMARLLKRGGTLVVDLNNPMRVLRYFLCNENLKEEKISHPHKRRTDVLSNGLKITTNEEFDIRESKWRMERKWNEAGKVKCYKLSLRIYTFSEIKRILEENNFKVTSVFGTYKLTNYNATSKRMIVVAKRK